MPSSNSTIPQKSNIVSVHFDASFFFERGTRSLRRQDPHKALKYFQKCVELEDRNPHYLIHLAATYTEIGLFEESNRILTKIVNEIDEELTECYYYIANNCAHMGDFDQAEQYALLYQQEEPDGAFVEDAEELLDIICYELERTPKELDVEHKLIAKHEKSKYCLEEGKFLEATRLLEEMVEEYPHFLAARNNLALGYYYLGQFDRAMSVLQEILRMDNANLHALCNLAVFYRHKGKDKEVGHLINGLKKIYPIQIDHIYKLAITLGILGEDERAYQLFKMLYKRGLICEDISLYHFLAVAAFNTRKKQLAKKYWQKLKQIETNRRIAEFYLQAVDDESFCLENRRLPYHYQLPYDVQFKQKEWMLSGTIPQDILNDPLIRSSLFWTLRTGNRETKIQVLHTFAYFTDHEVEQVLRQLILDPQEDDDVKKVAIAILHQVGAEPPYLAVLNNKQLAIDENRLLTSIFLDNPSSSSYDEDNRKEEENR